MQRQTRDGADAFRFGEARSLGHLSRSAADGMVSARGTSGLRNRAVVPTGRIAAPGPPRRRTVEYGANGIGALVLQVAVGTSVLLLRHADGQLLSAELRLFGVGAADVSDGSRLGGGCGGPRAAARFQRRGRGGVRAQRVRGGGPPGNAEPGVCGLCRSGAVSRERAGEASVRPERSVRPGVASPSARDACAAGGEAERASCGVWHLRRERGAH